MSKYHDFNETGRYFLQGFADGINKNKNTSDILKCHYMQQPIDVGLRVVIGQRMQGKTLLLIKEASETNGIIVCPTPRMADYAFRMASDLGYRINIPITYDQMRRYPPTKKYYFDEYGMQLCTIIHKWFNDIQHMHHIETVIIDQESIRSINDILSGMKISDMDGKKLRLKIEVCKEESDD